MKQILQFMLTFLIACAPDFLQEEFTANYHRIPMCFMEDKLVIALDSEIRIYSILPLR